MIINRYSQYYGCSFVFILIVMFTISKDADDSKSNQRVKRCYERTVLPLKYNYDNSELPIYDGYDLESEYLDTIYLYHDLYSKEDYKRQTLNRSTSFPRTKIEDISEMVIVVNDTSKFQEEYYEFEYIDQSLIVTQKHTKWMEVVCQDKVNENLLELLCEEFYISGYTIDCEEVKYDKYFKANLTKFQKRNGLPVGNLNIRTMKFLNISQ